MNCINDENLYLLLDGELDRKIRPAIIDHISSVDRFWEQFQEENCPEENVIYDYHLGLLEGDDQKNVSEHMKSCWLCRDKIKELDDMEKEILKIEQNTLYESKNLSVPTTLKEWIRSVSKEFIKNHYPEE